MMVRCSEIEDRRQTFWLAEVMTRMGDALSVTPGALPRKVDMLEADHHGIVLATPHRARARTHSIITNFVTMLVTKLALVITLLRL